MVREVLLGLLGVGYGALGCGGFYGRVVVDLQQELACGGVGKLYDIVQAVEICIENTVLRSANVTLSSLSVLSIETALSGLNLPC